MTNPIKHTRENTILLFDVDGTLTPARLDVEQEMRELLPELRKRVSIGFVGGSDLVKQKEQLGDNVLDQFDYGFAENGLDAYKGVESIERTSYIKWIGEEKHRKLIEWLLVRIAQLDVPIKRGTFVEFRNGMLNVSPIGRNCSQEEREWFAKYDEEKGIRKQLIADLKNEFKDYGLNYSIGGQISIDIFPVGWDKTYALRYVRDKFEHIHFFGDKTMEGGNDYEIFSSDETIGHTVTSYHDTIRLCKELFMKDE
mmetsp:Transcript_4686/g.17618  ORF Transcript_4686/g.17618 Transcript_4686/m.17618 type:complete len:254 (-) Transcript_4686:574-1335(-)